MNNLNELENNGVIVYRVSHHHEAMQAVNDTVISMQKLDEMALDAPLSAVQAKHIANQTLATFPALNTLDSRLVLHRFLDKLNQSNQHTNIQSIQNSIINMQEKLPAIMEQSRQILDKSKDKGGRER